MTWKEGQGPPATAVQEGVDGKDKDKDLKRKTLERNESSILEPTTSPKKAKETPSVRPPCPLLPLQILTISHLLRLPLRLKRTRYQHPYQHLRRRNLKQPLDHSHPNHPLSPHLPLLLHQARARLPHHSHQDPDRDRVRDRNHYQR
jgi:hypothetical protein